MATTLPSRSPFADPALSTFADLIDRIAGDTVLPLRQRRNWIWALRLIARAAGKAQAQIPAHPEYLRPIFKKSAPASLGITKAAWNNARSLAGKGMEWARDCLDASALSGRFCPGMGRFVATAPNRDERDALSVEPLAALLFSSRHPPRPSQRRSARGFPRCLDYRKHRRTALSNLSWGRPVVEQCHRTDHRLAATACHRSVAATDILPALGGFSGYPERRRRSLSVPCDRARPHRRPFHARATSGHHQHATQPIAPLRDGRRKERLCPRHADQSPGNVGAGCGRARAAISHRAQCRRPRACTSPISPIFYQPWPGDWTCRRRLSASSA